MVFSHRPGITFLEIYSLTISFTAIHIVLWMTPFNDKEIVQWDIITAFLGIEIEKLIYLELSKELTISSQGTVILRDD